MRELKAQFDTIKSQRDSLMNKRWEDMRKEEKQYGYENVTHNFQIIMKEVVSLRLECDRLKQRISPGNGPVAKAAHTNSRGKRLRFH